MTSEQRLSPTCEAIKAKLEKIAKELGISNNQMGRETEIAELREEAEKAGCPMIIDWIDGKNQVVLK